MPKKFTDLAELTSLDFADILPVVDTSANTSKKITVETLTSLLIPAGITAPFAGSTAPSGWLLCDGSAVSRSTYARLYAVISTSYGTGDGTTTFNLPNLKGRVAVGRDSVQTEFDTIGETGGAKTHTLTTTEMPVHSHVVQPTMGIGSSSAGHGFVDGANARSTAPAGWSTQTAGSGGAHNNLQPYIVTNYIIKV